MHSPWLPSTSLPPSFLQPPPELRNDHTIECGLQITLCSHTTRDPACMSHADLCYLWFWFNSAQTHSPRLQGSIRIHVLRGSISNTMWVLIFCGTIHETVGRNCSDPCNKSNTKSKQCCWSVVLYTKRNHIATLSAKWLPSSSWPISHYIE